MIQYFKTFLSPKKLTHRYVSFLAMWDDKTTFQKTSALRKFSVSVNTKVGRYSSIASNTKVANAVVGNYTVIARESRVGLGVHPTNRLTPHSIFYKNSPWGFHPEWVEEGYKEPIKPVVIGNDVWIGAHSMIMDGVKVGDGAIIAAGSVVTKDVPPFAVVGGAPAKLIRYRFSEDVIARLQEVKWWDLPDEEITKVVDLFHQENPTLEDINRYFPTKIK